MTESQQVALEALMASVHHVVRSLVHEVSPADMRKRIERLEQDANDVYAVFDGELGE